MTELEQQGAPEADTIDTLPGVVHLAHVVVQCLRCVEQGRAGVIKASLRNPEPADLQGVEVHGVSCPDCSSELGRPMAVPVIYLAGEQVGTFFGEEGDAGELGEPAAVEEGSDEADNTGGDGS